MHTTGIALTNRCTKGKARQCGPTSVSKRQLIQQLEEVFVGWGNPPLHTGNRQNGPTYHQQVSGCRFLQHEALWLWTCLTTLSLTQEAFTMRVFSSSFQKQPPSPGRALPLHCLQSQAICQTKGQSITGNG